MDKKSHNIRTIIVFVILLCVSALNIKAQNVGDVFKVGQLSYMIFKTSPAEVYLVGEASERPKGDVIIPSQVKFKDVDYTVTTIQRFAFNNCKELTSVQIPKSVIKINPNAFIACTLLKAINVAEDNPNYMSENGILFTKDKTVLVQYAIGKTETEYVMPNTVKIIEEGSFFCTTLTKITIPNSVTTIGKGAFDSAHLSSITIPKLVTNMGENVFYRCTKLTSINVVEENKNYSSKDGVLFNKEVTTLIKYPESKEDKEYKIPKTVTNIELCAFASCKYLFSLTIPKSVKQIGHTAFAWSKILVINSEIEDPSKVTLGGRLIFYLDKDNCKLYVPSGTLAKYKNAEQWKELKYIIEEKVTGISLNETSKELKINETYTLVPTINPEEATIKELTWESSNAKIVKVDNKGVITGVADGDAIITATTIDGNFKATCNVNVTKQAVTGITLNETSKELKINETFTLKVTLKPDDATNKNITWISSQTDIATVDNKGVVTALAVGKTTITATAEDNGLTATCEVTVTKATGINDNTAYDIKIYPTLVNSGFTIDYSNINKVYILNIYSQTGKKVKTEKLTNNEQFINVSSLQSGVYFVKVGEDIIKFMKQ